MWFGAYTTKVSSISDGTCVLDSDETLALPLSLTRTFLSDPPTHTKGISQSCVSFTVTVIALPWEYKQNSSLWYAISNQFDVLRNMKFETVLGCG